MIILTPLFKTNHFLPYPTCGVALKLNVSSLWTSAESHNFFNRAQEVWMWGDTFSPPSAHTLSPPHLLVEVLLHHVLERPPHPVPPPVEHVGAPSHEPAAEHAQLSRAERGIRGRRRWGVCWWERRHKTDAHTQGNREKRGRGSGKGTIMWRLEDGWERAGGRRGGNSMHRVSVERRV